MDDQFQHIDDIVDMTDAEVEQAYLDWENSNNYQIEDLGVNL